MQELNRSAIVIDRPASLEDIARTLGYAPIPRAEMQAHMTAELEKAPTPIPFAALLHAGFVQFMTLSSLGGVLCFVVGIIMLFAGSPHWPSAFFASGLLTGFVLSFDTWFGNRHMVLKRAQWGSADVSLRERSMFQLEQMAYARALEVKAGLQAMGVHTIAHKHTLMQDSRPLDPVIELVNLRDASDRFCVAIYDTNSNEYRFA